MPKYYLKDENTLETLDIDNSAVKISFGSISRGFSQTQGVGNSATITGAGIYGAPSVTLTFDFRGTSGSAMNTTRDTILKWFSKTQNSELYLYVLNYDESRTTRVRVYPADKGAESYSRILVSSSVALAFYMKTAYFENVSESTDSNSISGTVMNTVTVDYSAPVEVSPIFTFTAGADFSLIQVQSYSDGYGFKIEDSFLSGDVIAFDCSTAIVTVNDTIRSGILSAGGGFPLAYGTNTLRVWATDGTLDVSYYERWL